MSEESFRLKELRAMRKVVEAAIRLREAHGRVLAGHATEEILEAVREEARALRSLDSALRDLPLQASESGRVNERRSKASARAPSRGNQNFSSR